MSRLSVLIGVLAVSLAILLSGAQSTQAASCTFVLGFKAIHDQIPDIVGDCTSDEYHGANGDGLQNTVAWHGKGGLLAWRKADNWTAFTDGANTWVNGPNGLQKRPNDQRFPFENDRPTQPAPAAPTATAAPAPQAHDYFVQRLARPSQVRAGGAVSLCAKLSSPTLPPVGGLTARIRYNGVDYQAITALPSGEACVTVPVTSGCGFDAWINYQGVDIESPGWAGASCQVLRY